MFHSINPYTNEVIKSYQEHSVSDINQIIGEVHQSFLKWRTLSIEKRAVPMNKMAENLIKNKEKYAGLITSEMGKILTESIAEIEKCAWLCQYYAENASAMLEPEIISSDATKSYVRFDSVGTIYAIMPWNFPFWQVLRFAVPTIMAGNTVVLKHAPNVIGCSKAIEELFIESGFPNNIFRNLIIPVELSDIVIAHELIQGVTITGSQRAGRAVASQAGKYLKKSVLELGGSDPYIVFADADFNTACRTGSLSRNMNSGQVCISAKRFIVEDKIFDQFVREQKTLLESLKPGDPLSPDTTLAPMARKDLQESIHHQVMNSIKQGAKLVTGGYPMEKTNFYAPTLLTDVKKGMPVYDEETFGPVSVVIPFKDMNEAIELANDTSYGLGASIWSNNTEKAVRVAAKIEAGAVFINGMTKSDPRLPFGGTKRSGYGRELSHFGIREFLNIKTVWLK